MILNRGLGVGWVRETEEEREREAGTLLREWSWRRRGILLMDEVWRGGVGEGERGRERAVGTVVLVTSTFVVDVVNEGAVSVECVRKRVVVVDIGVGEGEKEGEKGQRKSCAQLICARTLYSNC
jgi:hypothetical protein